MPYKTIIIGAGLAVITTLSQSSQWPSKPIKILVGFPPGQSTDLNARFIADILSKNLNTPVIVDNRPGQAGSIALSQLKSALPDGYTIGLTATAALSTNPYLYKNIRYNVKKDFIPITRILSGPLFLLANKNAPFNNLEEFVSFAKENPGKLNYCSSGNGTISHLSMEEFKRRAGIELVHIPYTGSAQSMADLSAGNVSVCFDTANASLPGIEGKKIKVLAVGSANRSQLFPDIPSFQEKGYEGFVAEPYIGFLAPAGTPNEIIEKLTLEIKKTSHNKRLVDQLTANGSNIIFDTSFDFLKIIESDSARWKNAIDRSGISID